MSNKPLSDDSISNLSQMIESREARVAILGLGYVGLPLLRAFWDGAIDPFYLTWKAREYGHNTCARPLILIPSNHT